MAWIDSLPSISTFPSEVQKKKTSHIHISNFGHNISQGKFVTMPLVSAQILIILPLVQFIKMTPAF
jgi:hypothetical protein